MKKRIACLITGVPRGHQRCLPALRFLLEEWDVTYFAVMREEFATEETVICLRSEIPGIRTIVVPKHKSEAAVTEFNGLNIASTVVQMWHEVWYGATAIQSIGKFDFTFRTRFDIYFHQQYLPEVREYCNEVWLPEQMSWSGSNDMICLAPSATFFKYAETYKRLPVILAEGIGTPEAILSRSISIAKLVEKKLDVYFVLYRDALFSRMTDVQLNVLAHVHPTLSTFKIGGKRDSDEARINCIKSIETATKDHCGFPLYETNPNFGHGFYAAETDVRDGTTFRFMGLHAHMRRALPKAVCGLQFKVHFHVPGWDIQCLSVLIDGRPLTLQAVGQDQFGRLTVSGLIKGNESFRRPWSKITFNSRPVVVPAEIHASSNDRRAISVAIGNIEYLHREDNPNAKAPCNADVSRFRLRSVVASMRRKLSTLACKR
jgi:hypothetical protein